MKPSTPFRCRLRNCLTLRPRPISFATCVIFALALNIWAQQTVTIDWSSPNPSPVGAPSNLYGPVTLSIKVTHVNDILYAYAVNAAVDRPFGDHLPAFDPHRYSGKIGYDSADITSQFVLRPDRHTQIRRDDYRNVTAAGGKEGIGHGLARQQAGDDAADGRRNAHAAGNVVEIHAAPGILAAHAFG